MDKILAERGAREACERDAETMLNLCFGYIVDERSLEELGARLKGIAREHTVRVSREEVGLAAAQPPEVEGHAV